MEDLLRGALLAQSDDALRDYSKTKNRLNRVFSFSLWAVLPLFLRYFFTLLILTVFVLNFKPVPFVILLIIGTLIPIQTSTEEYILEGI
jgi:hypothetical protein